MTQSTPVRLPEFDVRLSPSADGALTHPSKSIGPQDSSTLKSTDTKLIPSTCHCYIPSTPNQHFRVMVTSNIQGDACVTLLVDGELVYSGLSYQPNHKSIYFSGRYIDESTLQEMKFVDLDTTCISFLLCN
jgi:hypothetical protein